MRKFINILLFALLPLFSVAQNFTAADQKKIDSTNSIIHNTSNEDTLIANAYLSLSEYLFSSSFDTIYYLSNKAKEIAEQGLEDPENNKIKMSFMKSLATAYGNIGYVNKYRGNIDEALDYYYKSLELSKKTNDKNGISSMYNNIGIIHGSQGNIKKALEYYQKCMQIREEIGDKKGLAAIYNNIGEEYRKQGDLDKTLEYYKKSMSYSQLINNEKNLARNMSNIGYVYFTLNEIDTALIYWQKSLRIRQKIGDEYGKAQSYTNLASIKEYKNELDSALDYLSKALEIYEELGANNNKLPELLGKISRIYFKKKNIKTALSYGEKGLELSKESGFLIGVMQNANNLYFINKSIGNSKKALSMHELYINIKDSIQNDENQQEIIKHEFKYNYEKQHFADSLDFIKKQEVKEMEITRQQSELKSKRNQQYVLYGGLILVIFFSLFIFNRFRITQNQKLVIEDQKMLVDQKNREITDSIQYAKRIQNAILPPDKVVKEYLKNSFILYKPKDIVAGDFYWMECIPNPSEGGAVVLFAVADCTGHGVPGAMVSVVCNNGLNRSVREYGLTEPGKILDKTREIVIQEFEKSEENVKDGMDIALCALSTNQIEYAGANIALWIIRNGEIIETKPDKQPIGKFDNPLPYTTHQQKLIGGDSIYIFTDGYADQFGGEKGKKFKTQTFRDLLLSMQNESMENQKRIIDDTFEKWKGDLEQVDDICIIGVKI